MILNRSSLLTVFLLAATLAVSGRTYLLWKEEPWSLLTPVKRGVSIAVTESKPDGTPRQLPNTDVIVSRNLFDPERGASVMADPHALQRIRTFVLLGTAILGSNRYAILQDGSPLPPGRPSPEPLRVKVGDVVEGFSLSEIRDKSVVFSKDASRIELALDYFRKVDVPVQGRVPTTQPDVTKAVPVPAQVGAVPVPAQVGAVPVPAQVRPVSPVEQRVLPQLPGQERLPASPTRSFPQQSSSIPSPSPNAPLLPEIPRPHR